MKSILIKPSKLTGKITAPPSKSLSHRAVICASLCNDGGTSIIDNVILSEDIEATINGMRQFGANIRIRAKEDKKYCLDITGGDKIISLNSDSTNSSAEINCIESGSTLRFLIPIALAMSKKCTFTGQGKLVERPLNVYYKLFKEQNIIYENNNGALPLTVNGSLQGGTYEISGSVSSQFISGLFFALPLVSEDSKIIVSDKLESVGYIDLTLDILKKFNIEIINNDYKEFIIPGNSQYKSTNYTVEGDYSQAAFFLTAKAIGNDLSCVGLNEHSLQGDREIINIIESFQKNTSDEIIIDASQIPDLVPILTVLASLKDNKTIKITNAGRLRIKESDRLKAIATEMNKLGANILELDDGLLIKGQNSLFGKATVNSWNDHRIAMSLAVAATKCENEIVLEGYTAVNKSYPEFWNDYKALGGVINELNMGK